MPSNKEFCHSKESDYDKYICKIIRHLLFIDNQLEIFSSKKLTSAYAQSKFTTKDGEFWIKRLGERLSKMSNDNLKLVIHKKDSKKSKKLFDWWESYKKMDDKNHNDFFKQNNISL